MRSRIARLTLVAAGVFLGVATGCGQSELKLPPSGEGNDDVCGDWYPGAAEDAGSIYGFETGLILPCVVFKSARLGEDDTYINWGGMYLDAAYGHRDTKSVSLVVGADNCPSCALFIRDLADNAERVAAAGAELINVTFCDNIDRTDCAFDLDRAVSTATSEGWPIDRWYVTNDEDGYVSPLYRDSFPTVITARISDLQIVAVDRAPVFETFIDLLETL